MSDFEAWGVAIVVACAAVYTVLQIVKERRRYNQRQKELERWFAARKAMQEEERDKWR